MISRDRWPAYAKAATEAAPQAKQVADRWHLLKNLREAVEEFLARPTTEIREAAAPVLTFANGLSSIPTYRGGEPVRFAGSLSSDETAVSSALTEPWSNGQVEGRWVV